MEQKIKYMAPPANDNSLKVYEFIGKEHEYVCLLCGGSGEYESEYGGTVGCDLCCSRLIPFWDYQHTRQDTDWGDTILRKKDGLHLVKGK
ncbi:MAG: hypothetical protein WC124_10720 [Desulfoplanes sp.]